MNLRNLVLLVLTTCPMIAAGCDDSISAPAPGHPVTVTAPAEGPVEQATTPEDSKTDRPAPPTIKDDSGPQMLARVLQLVVTDAGLVRYDMFAERELREALERVITWYDRTAVPMDRNEKLAFLCNAYNANVLSRAYRESVKPGFESVVKVPGFFDARPIRVGREGTTLNDLENKMIRPIGDARIHAALVCAAMSCPPLRNEPYRAMDLDTQFDDQCKRWVNDSTKFKIVNGQLGLSEILNWYGDDFNKPPYGNHIGFVLAYADTGGEIARFIANRNKPPTHWLTYDWTLNAAK